MSGRIEKYPFERLPSLGKTAAGDDLKLGGFSGLVFLGKEPETGKLLFMTHTDRGPNTEPFDVDGDGRPERGFPLPSFNPELVRFSFDPMARKLEIEERIPLKQQDGKPLSGLPNLPGAKGSPWSDEVGVDLKGKVLSPQTLGADLEGLVVAPDGTFWLSDEYRPSLFHFDARGVLIERYIPKGGSADLGTPALPEVLASRKANRGFEALAQVKDKLYAFVQSPLVTPKAPPKGAPKPPLRIRVIEFDLRSRKTTGQYLYRLEHEAADKIGDATAKPDGTLLVVERDEETGPTAVKRLYAVRFDTATNLETLPPEMADANSGIDYMTDEDLKQRGIISAAKEMVLDVVAKGFDYAEKLEGVALVDEHTLAFVNDNDFGLSGGYDPKTGKLVPALPVKGSYLGLYRGF